MLNQVWVNLLENAIKFNRENGIVSVNVKKKEENIFINISDTGRGISKEFIPKIFDKFYQKDDSRSASGYGLGLAIVKRIVELSKGSIYVKSELNKGSTFIISLSRG